MGAIESGFFFFNLSIYDQYCAQFEFSEGLSAWISASPPVRLILLGISEDLQQMKSVMPPWRCSDCLALSLSLWLTVITVIESFPHPLSHSKLLSGADTRLSLTWVRLHLRCHHPPKWNAPESERQLPVNGPRSFPTTRANKQTTTRSCCTDAAKTFLLKWNTMQDILEL